MIHKSITCKSALSFFSNSFILIGILLVVFGRSDLSAQNDPVLLSIDDKKVHLSEFKYIYEKNNRDEQIYSKESLQEYLKLYTNFKLKVAKAKELGYHERPSYQKELAGYRTQLADSYVIDREVVDKIAEDILDRKKWDVEVSHILVSVKRKDNQKRIDDALKNIRNFKTLLDDGASFEELVSKYSDDKNSIEAGGSLGYITSALPDGYVELEDVAYQLKEGEISRVIRTDLGYHVVKVGERRPARGKMDAAHIMIRKSKNRIPIAGTKDLIDSVYRMVTVHNMDFDQVAKTMSQDKTNSSKGGRLGFFGIGRFEAGFEAAAFALLEDGQVSEPIQTSIGWHVIKRIEKKKPETKGQLKELVKGQLMDGERFNKVKDKVIFSLKKEAGFNEDISVLKTLIDSLDVDFYDYKWSAPAIPNRRLFTYDDQEYFLRDFTEFIISNSRKRLAAKGRETFEELTGALYKEFVNQKAIVYAEKHLEDRYVDFRNLIREYEEGILLFEITKDMVWDKAAKDTSGLRTYFEKNSKNYKWDDRAIISKYTLRSVDTKLVAQIMNDALFNDSDFVEEKYNTAQELVIHKNATFEKGSKNLEGLSIQENSMTTPDFNRSLKLTVFKKVNEVIPARQKTLKEARGYVISDYQDELELQWVKELRGKYKVSVKKKVLNRLIKQR